MDLGYFDLKEAVPVNILVCLEEAKNEMWPFMPDPRKAELGDAALSIFYQELESPNLTFPDLTNYQLLQKGIEKAMDEELFSEAMSIIFVIDRYVYYKYKHEVPKLLSRVQEIVDRCPEVAVAPQLIGRMVRLLKDQGDYQTADKIVTSVLSQAANCVDSEEYMIGTWRFKTRQKFLLTVSHFLMLKGMIQMYLAQYLDAAVYLVTSGQLTYSINPRGQIVMGQCLQYLTDIVQEMGSVEINELQELITFNTTDASPAQFLTENAAKLLKSLNPKDVYFVKQMRRLARIELMQAVKAQDEEKSNHFNTLMGLLKACIPEDLEKTDFRNQEVAHDFASTIFNIHLAYNYFGYESSSMLCLAMELFINACGHRSQYENSYFRREIENVRVGMHDVEAEKYEKDKVIDYPILRHMTELEMLRGFHDPVIASEYKVSALVSASDQDSCFTTIDPVAITCSKSGLLPSNLSKHQPKIFVTDESVISPGESSAGAVIAEGSVYVSLLNEPIIEKVGFDSPRKLLATKDEQDQNISRSRENVNVGTGAAAAESNPMSSTEPDRILETNLTRNTVYRANVSTYNSFDNKWRHQQTLVFVHDELKLHENKKGSHRDVIKLQYLHQDDFAMYLGKRYRKQKHPEAYHNDVITQQLARHSVTRFNKRLQNSKFTNRIQMVSVVYIEILDESNRVLEVVNAEPFINGNFRKMTNNLDSVNADLDPQLQLAFSHFSWCDSEEKYMVTDLQGWIHEDPKIPVLLTDPAINSDRLDKLRVTGKSTYGTTDMGKEGVAAFFTKQHPTCNAICEMLDLYRGPKYSSVV